MHVLDQTETAALLAVLAADVQPLSAVLEAFLRVFSDATTRFRACCALVVLLEVQYDGGH